MWSNSIINLLRLILSKTRCSLEFAFKISFYESNPNSPIMLIYSCIPIKFNHTCGRPFPWHRSYFLGATLPLGALLSRMLILRKSSRELVASRKTWLGWKENHPMHRRIPSKPNLARYHSHELKILHSTSSQHLLKHMVKVSPSQELFLELLCAISPPHTSCAEGQFHNMCFTVSSSLEHRAQHLFWINYVSWVCRILPHAFHMNILTAFGIFKF